MHSGRKDTFWITNGYTTSRWPTRCTILIINFYSTVFSCSTCFERITRSSSGALPNILYHAVWYNRAAVQLDSSARLYRLYCVIQYTKQCSWWWTSNSFEICRARKYGGIKIIYRTVHVVGQLQIPPSKFWVTEHKETGQGDASDWKTTE